MGRDVGFIKWRISTLNFEISGAMKRANIYHNRGNRTKLDETIIIIEKLKSERASWFDKLAEAEFEVGKDEMVD